MAVLSGLFNVVSLLYVFRAAQLAIQIGRNWTEIRQEPLTRAKQQLAEQSAFFISVPPSVLIHELFHALAIWLFGGEVVDFGYRVFWGFVVPAGDFTDVQQWFISLAGTLGSLLFGATVWLALRHNPSRTVRYFGLRTFRFQIYFSLLYYPLITIILPVGDWRVIYGFANTPVLSAATAATHVVLLLFFWRADRRGAFEMVAFNSTAEETLFRQAESAAALGDNQSRLLVIQAMELGGAPHSAKREVTGYLAQHPESADGYLLMATVTAGQRGQVSAETRDYTEKALQLGLNRPESRSYALQILARYALDRGDGATADQYLSQAIQDLEGGATTTDPVANPGQTPQVAQLYYLRSQARRRQGRLEEAQVDASRAVMLAEQIGDQPAAERYQEELQVIAKHGGYQAAVTTTESTKQDASSTLPD